MTKSNFLKKILRRHFSDVIINTLPKNVTKLTSQDFFHFGFFPIKISAYAIVMKAERFR